MAPSPRRRTPNQAATGDVAALAQNEIGAAFGTMLALRPPVLPNGSRNSSGQLFSALLPRFPRKGSKPNETHTLKESHND
jgi:hypothetical protein